MSTLVGPTLGSFLNICRAASVLPVCQAFILRGDKTCTLMGVSIATTKITDILDVALCILCALAMIYVAYRTHSKYAAVGRSEMGILNLLYFCMLVVQIPSVGGWMTSQPELTNAFFLWSSIIHTALIATTGWVLLLNGFVGFQLVTDGTPASVYSIAVTAFLVFTGTGYVAADTVYGWTTVFAPGTNLVSLPLFALEFLVPVVAVLVYMLCQVLLVYTQLSVRKPLRMFLSSPPFLLLLY
ncbi:chitin synthase III catalytic subunit [Blastocladiella britannica]|nr:chitin synthase III catalytic subunit [Blastocladiella britannica]